MSNRAIVIGAFTAAALIIILLTAILIVALNRRGRDDLVEQLKAASKEANKELQNHAYVMSAQVQIDTVAQECELFKMDVQKYPATLEELTSDAGGKIPGWQGPYSDRPLGPDPWGNSYRYNNPGVRNVGKVDIWSCGPDGKNGTADDIFNREGN